MNVQIKEANGKRYLELVSTDHPIGSEDDARDLIALCWEHESSLLLIQQTILSEEFFNLKTGLAGILIQKLVNYNIKAAAIIPQEAVVKGRFKEMALEINKGQHFRMYEDPEEATQWLVK